jgi:pimeloyl-ACP methyl ester carboxylesterase
VPTNPLGPQDDAYSDERSGRLSRARLSVIAVVACLLLLLGPSLWNVLLVKWQHAHNPVPGAFYTVEGSQMHIDCTGAGSPTIVMEHAASASWLLWRRVQPELSKLTRVCSYDRAGHGWSPPRSRPRDAETIVRELHSLLDQAGVKRPIVLVAHSAGGLYAREYAREFPSELAGVALIDASSPQQIEELPGWRASYENDKQDQQRELPWDNLRVWSGWDRLLGHCHFTPSKKDESFAGQYQAMQCRPGYVDTDESELTDFEQSSKEATRLESFGKIPLLIISQDTGLCSPGMTTNQLAQNPVWEREQEESKSLSPLSWRVIAHGSGHMVPLNRPDVIIVESTRLINYLRGGPTPQFGSTVTE